jgi:hypothetical protein
MVQIFKSVVMVSIIDQNKLKLNLAELERVLPHQSFVRIQKYILKKEGFVNLSEFARQNGKTKQSWSKHILGDISILGAPNLIVLRIGGKVYVKKKISK